MKIFRDEERMETLKKRGQRASLIGFIILLAGFVLIWVFSENPNVLLYQMIALIAGFSLSQYGAYLTHRYGRSPRPDEVLDESVKAVTRDGRMYHYLLPAPHILLTKAGPIVFVLKYQVGKISADGSRWTQKGIGFRRYFGQEGLGNPSKEAESAVKALANYIRQEAQDIEEVPIAAMIVFTSNNIAELDVEDSDYPAMHASKVKGYLRRQGLGEKIPTNDYQSLQQAFDQSAIELS